MKIVDVQAWRSQGRFQCSGGLLETAYFPLRFLIQIINFQGWQPQRAKQATKCMGHIQKNNPCPNRVCYLKVSAFL